MTEKEKAFASWMGNLAKKDMKKTGILASVTTAQAILESGYGTTDLAKNANNYFGMKCTLSGNSWDSVWDGVSKYTKQTTEDDGTGHLHYEKADFRKYSKPEDSVEDHSRYLLGAKKGSAYRYTGLKGEKDPLTAINIIKAGGYATDIHYVSKIMSIIDRFELIQYDKLDDTQKEEKTMGKVVKIGTRKVNDITTANQSQVPRSRGGNPIEFIVVHYLGVPNADNPNLYGGGYGGHYNIKRDGSIYMAANPKTAVVWHCGGGLQGSGGHEFHGICTNYNSIGIECGVGYTDPSVKEPDAETGKWYFTEETQESLVWLVSALMDKYGIGIDHVIRHYSVTGKYCPAPYVANNHCRTSWTWSEFIANVKQYRKDGTITIPDGTAVPAPSPDVQRNYLKRGDSGIEVSAMQKMLNHVMGAGLTIDGDFGPATEEAVKAFQKKTGLTVDGLYGAETKAKLTALVAEIDAAGKSSTIYRVQTGAFTNKRIAKAHLKKVQSVFNDAFLTEKQEGYYRVQVGAFGVYSNAIHKLATVQAAGFDAIIKTYEQK